VNARAGARVQAHLEWNVRSFLLVGANSPPSANHVKIGAYLPGAVGELLANEADAASAERLTTVASLCGFVGQLLVAASLFFYQASMVDLKHNNMAAGAGAPAASWALRFLRATHFLGLNLVFSGGKSYHNTRAPSITGPDDWKQGEARFLRILAKAGGNRRTGDQYLVIGVGFVGKRLVQRLLDRGETRIRLFDITPVNSFAGNPHVEYVRGDVTKLDQVSKACEGVDTVYSIFAIIRFMDRLEHQAALSYRINVGGVRCCILAMVA